MQVRERISRPTQEDADEGPPQRPEPIDWWKLDGEERSLTLEHLSGFVLHLTKFYVLPEQVIPRCWFKHDALIQELLALFQYRNQERYLSPASAQGPIDFHNALSLSLTRLRGWVDSAGCTGVEHFPDQERYAAWMRPGSVTLAEWKTEFQEYVDDMSAVVGGLQDEEKR